MISIIKDGDKFYPQQFLEESFYDAHTSKQSI